MARLARFKIYGRFNGASAATVTIDRSTDIVTVRPLRRRKTYEMTLGGIAEMIIYKVIQQEIREKNKDKKKRRLVRRGLL
jgi:hypothetical protein